MYIGYMLNPRKGRGLSYEHTFIHTPIIRIRFVLYPFGVDPNYLGPEYRLHLHSANTVQQNIKRIVNAVQFRSNSDNETHTDASQVYLLSTTFVD